jgi:hypothetical protein
MDSAVWGMQAVVDNRQREREADAAAHRQARDVVRPSDVGGRRVRPFRWPFRRPLRFEPAAAVAVVAAPEPAGDDLELVGAGDPR